MAELDPDPLQPRCDRQRRFVGPRRLVRAPGVVPQLAGTPGRVRSPLASVTCTFSIFPRWNYPLAPTWSGRSSGRQQIVGKAGKTSRRRSFKAISGSSSSLPAFVFRREGIVSAALYLSSASAKFTAGTSLIADGRLAG